MTRDDIIRMAREAGLKHREAAKEFNSPYCDGVYLDDLDCFAAIVAAAEREACAKVCESIGRGHGFAIAEIDCAEAIRAREGK